MNNKQKYNQVFMESLSVDESALGDKLEYNTISSWDSIGHMTMISDIEEAFDIAMETEDVIDFSSYEKGIEILAKYGINI